MRPDENEDKFDSDPDATGWELTTRRIDTKTVLAGHRGWRTRRHLHAEQEWGRAEQLWDALAQEIIEHQTDNVAHHMEMARKLAENAAMRGQVDDLRTALAHARQLLRIAGRVDNWNEMVDRFLEED